MGMRSDESWGGLAVRALLNWSSGSVAWLFAARSLAAARTDADADGCRLVADGCGRGRGRVVADADDADADGCGRRLVVCGADGCVHFFRYG